jgi:imidazolonepropionase-like amidohydrolase/Tol biopolymer transport system component
MRQTHGTVSAELLVELRYRGRVCKRWGDLTMTRFLAPAAPRACATRRAPGALVLALAIAGGCASPRGGEQAAPNPSTRLVAFEAREGTRLALDVAPDGRTIVFDLLGQLWQLPIEGGRAVALTDAARDTAEDLDPAISPDGAWIAFQGDRPGGRTIWLMPAAGGEPRRLSARELGYFAYAGTAWSPDSRRVAYAVNDVLGIVDVVTGEERVLRIDSLPPLVQAHPRLPHNGSPAWSPDGQRISFVNARGDGHVWEVPADGGAARRLTTVRAEAQAYSPDGHRLVFIARDGTNRWQVFVQDLAGGAAVRITDHEEVTPHRVRWTPDGRSLVYAADGGLWRVPASGGEAAAIPFVAPVRFERPRAALTPVGFPAPGVERPAIGFRFHGLVLAPEGRRVALSALDSVWIWTVGEAPQAVAAAPRGAQWLAWSPSGRELAWWMASEDGAAVELYITDTALGTTRRAAALPPYPRMATWSPDGRYLAFALGPRVRLLDVTGEFVDAVEAMRDAGPASVDWGGLAWSARGDALVAYTYPLWETGVRGLRGTWLPLGGEPRPIEHFPRAPSSLWFQDGHAVYVQDNLLWRVPFEGPTGMRGTPERVSEDAALNASYAADGSILYVSTEGLRIRRPDGTLETLGWPLRYRTAAAPPPLFIVRARVIDGSGAPPVGESDLLLEGGRIRALTPTGTAPPPAGVRVLDAEGRVVIPGMIDMHAHLWEEALIPGWLHNGVTTVRDIGSQRGLEIADLRNLIAAGARSGPRIVFAGSMFHGGPGLTTLSDQMVDDHAAIARGVRLNRALGAEYTKDRTHSNWHVGARIVAESHRHGMPVSGHCAHIIPLVAAGMDGREHVRTCFRDQAILREDFARLPAAAGMWITATVGIFHMQVAVVDDETLLGSPEVAPFLTPWTTMLYRADSAAVAQRAANALQVERYIDSAKRYAQAGATLLAGTDNMFPLGLHLELELLVAAGLSPMEAIMAATRHAARAMNAHAEIGTLEVGKWADLVILDADPLEDIRNIRRIWQVVQGGRVVDREALRR